MENQAPEIFTPQQPKSSLALWIVIGVVILAIGIGIGLAVGKYSTQPISSPISSYENCVNTEGSIVQMSYPATCVTVDGQRFIQPLTDEEKQNLQPPDSTANWKTFTNDKYHFSFMYPPTWSVETNDRQDFLNFYDQEYNNNFSIRLSEMAPRSAISNRTFENVVENIKEYEQSSTANLGNFEPIQTGKEIISIDGKEAIKYIFHLNKAQSYDSAVWTFIEAGKNQLVWTSTEGSDKNTFDQILSTFKFIEPSASPTPQISYVRPEISDTSNWKLYTLKNIQFKAPEEARVSITDGDAVITLPEAMIPSANVMLRAYDGGSRRAWWIKEINATPDEVSKYMRFQDVMLGKVAALDVFGDGGWWQGGYASPILIAKGKTIIAIHGGRGLNPDTGKTSRYIFSDSVASTIKFIQ